MSSEDGQKKQGIVSKLADKLHIGHKKKNSTSSAGTSDDVMTEAPLAAGAQHGHSGTHSSSATPSTGAGSTATGSDRSPATTGAATGAATTGAGSKASNSQGITSRDTSSHAPTSQSSSSQGGAIQHGQASQAPAAMPGMTKESYSGKHTEGDVKEAGHNEQFSANNAEFQRARSLLDKASKESAQADAYTKQAYEKATEANRYRQEAEGAEAQVHERERELRQHQAVLNAAKGGEQGVERAKGMVGENERLANDAVRAAEEAAKSAREKYNLAKAAADDAEQKRAAAQKLADEAVARRDKLEGIDQKAALLAEEAKRHGEQARHQQAGLAAIAGQAEEAKAIAAQKRREAEQAEEMANNRTAALTAGQQAVQQHQTHSQAKMEEARGHALNAQQAREDLASIERRLALAEDEARQAKASTLEYADVAKIERERALAARTEAEKAGKNLQSARNLAQQKLQELEASKATIAEQEAAMKPLRAQIAQLEETCNRQYATAEESAREWAEVTNNANIHKGKWHEYWEEAKAHGDKGDKTATQHYDEMTAKVKDIVPDAIKNMVGGTNNEMHTSNTTKTSSQDTVGKTETGRGGNFKDAYNASANSKGGQLLEGAQERQNEKLGANLSAAQAGPVGASGPAGATQKSGKPEL